MEKPISMQSRIELPSGRAGFASRPIRIMRHRRPRRARWRADSVALRFIPQDRPVGASWATARGPILAKQDELSAPKRSRLGFSACRGRIKRRRGQVAICNDEQYRRRPPLTKRAGRTAGFLLEEARCAVNADSAILAS